MRKAELGLLDVDKDKADAEYKKYLHACKKNSYPHFDKMKKVYNQLRKGYQVIDVKQAMTRAGLNEQGEPILAIARADMKNIVFRRDYSYGTGFYERIDRWNFKKVFEAGTEVFGDKITDLRGRELETPVPPIPPEHIPDGKNPANYHILFEVKDWTRITTDPILLKHITGSLFMVLAKWDLSKVELMVLQGG
jgi:hypothetical protein